MSLGFDGALENAVVGLIVLDHGKRFTWTDKRSERINRVQHLPKVAGRPLELVPQHRLKLFEYRVGDEHGDVTPDAEPQNF